MKLFEMYTSVDKDGRITLPVESLVAAGLTPGKEVYVTLAVWQEDIEALYPQLIITPHGLEIALQLTGWLDDNGPSVPVTPDVTSETDDILDNLPDDLRELFDMLGINPDTVREVMRKEEYFV